LEPGSCLVALSTALALLDLRGVPTGVHQLDKTMPQPEETTPQMDIFKKKSKEQHIKEQNELAVEKRRVHVGGNVQGKNAPTAQLVMETNAATVNGDKKYLFQGPVSGRYFSVSTQAAAEEMRRRGFIEVRVDHFTDFAQLPEEEVTPDGPH